MAIALEQTKTTEASPGKSVDKQVVEPHIDANTKTIRPQLWLDYFLSHEPSVKYIAPDKWEEAYDRNAAERGHEVKHMRVKADQKIHHFASIKRDQRYDDCPQRRSCNPDLEVVPEQTRVP